jgi:hypothetical protein
MRSLRDFKNGIGTNAGKDLLNDEDKKIQAGTAYSFLSGYVKEIISDPYEYLNRPYTVNENTYNDVTVKDVFSGRIDLLPNGEKIDSPLKNFQSIANAPMNSAIVQIIDDSRGKDGEKPVICYPFFPSHFSLPLKVGEYVWLIEENIKGVINYYWMCRKTGTIQLEDVNFTNLERTTITSQIYDQHEKSGKTFIPSQETKEKMLALGKSDLSNIKEESYADILKNSYSHVRDFVGEPVPRLKKRSSDLLIQGSNNSGLHMTVEKFSDFSQEGTGDSLNDGYINAPAIDIFIKRIDNADNLDQMSTKNYSDSDEGLEYNEINKIRDIEDDASNITKNELTDSDATSIASRIYMSNNSNFDEDFRLDIDNLDAQSGTCIISYTKNNRLVGTDNTRILNITGESYIDMTESGNIVIKASKNNGQEFLSLNSEEKYARINTRATGKIYLTHQNGNDLPDRSDDEPYVLVSQLEAILENIYKILNAHNTAFFGLAPMRFPPLIPGALQYLQQVLIDTKIPTPPVAALGSRNESTETDLPIAAAPVLGLAAVKGNILRSSKIIADKE